MKNNTFKGKPVTPEVAAELEKIPRLNRENLVMLQKLITEIKDHNQAKLDNQCLKNMIKRMPKYTRIMGRLFWR